MLDAGDWHPSPAAPAFGNLGLVHVRFGKAMRGSAPRRRTVLSVFGWAVEEVLDLHALRHSYVTHLAEDGFPEKFVSEQVGHAYVSTMALYTSVSDDFKNRVLARALEPAFGAAGAGSGGDAEDGDPLAPARADGAAGHVRHHRPGAAAGRTRRGLVP